MLTVKEAARRLSLSQRTIYCLFHAGALKPLKVGRATHIATTELEGYIARLQASTK